MSELDDIRMLAGRVDDHNWWLGELEQYGMPPAYVEYFMAVKPSTVMDTFGGTDDMQYEIDELDRQVSDLEDENSDLERANNDLTNENDDLQRENESLHDQIQELERTIEDLSSD
jgi:FtsZ-binding cell division protein ZapB